MKEKERERERESERARERESERERERESEREREREREGWRQGEKLQTHNTENKTVPCSLCSFNLLGSLNDGGKRVQNRRITSVLADVVWP